MGPSGERGAGQGRPRAPSPSSPNWTRKGGSAPLFPSPSLLLPSLLLLLMEGGMTREGEERGAPPPPCPIRTRGGGHAALPWPPLLFSAKAHMAHYTPRGVPVTPRYFGICPNLPGTLPKSKHSHPIYRSLCLDHFETPRHVRDHIRDSELSSVHQNT